MFRRGPDRFETTHWSVVLAAGAGDADMARNALSRLCETYWYPLYLYVRRQGYDVEDARDLTQAFLVSLLDRNDVPRVTPDKGRFRSFLLGSLRHFLLNDLARRRTKKRGVQAHAIPLEFDSAEERYLREPVDLQTPETLFDQRWALDVLDRVLQRLRSDWEAAGKARTFDLLKGSLIGESAPGGYKTIADQLETTEAAIKIAVHRLRQQYQAHLRHEIAQTVSSSEEVDEELRYLFTALRR